MLESRKPALPLVGVSSLLVILSVVCLTVFALLAVSTVRADQRLSEKTTQAVEGYYAADFEAETILAQLRAGEHPADVIEENEIYSYSCPISNTQVLAVEVKITGTTYTVLRWQAVSTADWQADDALHVWSGE